MVSVIVKKRRTYMDTHGSFMENKLPYRQGDDSKYYPTRQDCQ